MPTSIHTTCRQIKNLRNQPVPKYPRNCRTPVVVALIPASPNRIMDLGCGNGAFASKLAGLGHTVVGCDESESGIAIARQRADGAVYLCRSVYAETPGEFMGQFDVVVSLETIEHLYFPGLLVQRAKEMLRANGTLIISTPYHGYLKNLVLALTGGMDRHFNALSDHGHIKFFSKRTLRVLLLEAGFQGVRFSGCGRVPLLWKSIVASCKKPGA